MTEYSCVEILTHMKKTEYRQAESDNLCGGGGGGGIPLGKNLVVTQE